MKINDITKIEKKNSTKFEIKFENELKNSITASVEMRPDDVRVILSGPKSMSENIITKKEAEVLYDLLKKALNK